MAILRAYNKERDAILDKWFGIKFMNGINRYSMSYGGGHLIKFILLFYRNELWVLEENNNFLGTGLIRRKLTLTTFKREFWLYDIWIHWDQRGKGYGKQLINLLLEHLQTVNKAQRVFLNVDKDNQIAINLYQTLGFEIVRQTRTQYIMRYAI